MKFKILELVLCFSIMITSCQKKVEEVLDNNQNSIKVIAQTATDDSFSTSSQNMSGNFLKTAYANPTVNWSTGDQIGVYSDKATVVTPPGIAKNVSFSCAVGGSKTADFTSSLTMTYGTGTNLFYAYYPFTGTSGNVPTNMTGYNVPITLPSEAQTQNVTGTAHIEGANDFMVAALTSGQASGTVGFTFNHVFSILRFRLSALNNSFPLISIKLVANTNICATNTAKIGSIDISQNVASNASYIIGSINATPVLSNTINLTTTGISVPKAPLSYDVHMLILPGNYTSLSILFTQSTGAGGKSVPVSKTGTFTFQRGKMYTTVINNLDPR